MFYFSNGNVKNIAFVKNDTLIEVDIYFKENGDSLKWFHNGVYGINGMFYKKWLEDGRMLTGNYGDTLRSFVVWKWFNENNKEVKSKIQKSKNEKYIAPE